MADVSNTDDIIDSRDVIERLAELEYEWDAGTADLLDAEERGHLLHLDAQGDSSHIDWRHGVTLVRDDYFTVYARHLAYDLGCVDLKAGWPSCHIDWDEAADSLRMDYTPVEFDGVTYWVG